MKSHLAFGLKSVKGIFNLEQATSRKPMPESSAFITKELT
jgi:hypothetical protein